VPPAARAPLDRQSEETHERIIDAAQAIFARDGFAGAKMQEIADRVGIQRPSLFYHFKNKEALFVAAHEQVFARIEPLYRKTLVPHGDPIIQLDRLTRAVLAVMEEEPDFARMVARTAVDRHPSAVAVMRNYVQPLVDLAVEFVRGCQERGIFNNEVDPFFFVLNSWGASLLYFTARDLLATPAGTESENDLHRFTDSLVRMASRALAPAPKRRRAVRSAS
jgi:TetR/AcrR family transcriptional regulator